MDEWCVTQIVVTDELSEENNFWLSLLHKDLTTVEFKRLLEEIDKKEPIFERVPFWSC
ncbi:MAG: hypothetical protein LBC74_03290 [Planctomycetaceae bacterium]|nr:hypothetical protein [Planctomycetaceae bacterium]